MITPGHMVMELAILGRKGRPGNSIPILLGAILPDLSIIGYYIYQRFFEGTPELMIWSIVYYFPKWQNLFDIFHSIPIFLLLAYITLRIKWERVSVFFAGALMHCVVDLPLNSEGAHRHLYPLNNWRLDSPIPYWDPRNFNMVGVMIEIGIVFAAGYWLLLKAEQLWVKNLVKTVWAFYVVGSLWMYLYLHEIV